MKWNVLWTGPAAKDLRRLDAATERRVHAAIGRFVGTGAGDIKRLQGRDAEWRLRVGDWRVLLHLDAAQRRLYVLGVRHRSDAYRD